MMWLASNHVIHNKGEVTEKEEGGEGENADGIEVADAVVVPWKSLKISKRVIWSKNESQRIEHLVPVPFLSVKLIQIHSMLFMAPQ